jgi:putative FmdB family regulatory protein
MPFYEYQCTNCGHHDEVLQSINDKPLRKCPNCGKNGLKKLMSAPVFRLKGSGWYETDFKSDKEKQRNLAGSEKEEPKAEAKTEAKSDSKADAAKTEAPKADAKSESPKPAGDKAGKGKPAREPAAARARPKAKPARKARR